MSEQQSGFDEIRSLAEELADLNEDRVVSMVRERMARGDDALRIIDECQAGMRQVGERYSQHTYYLAGLIMAGDILREVIEIVQPGIEEHFLGQTSGRILIGTVAGDIHDLGKSLLHMLLRCHGFTVRDLGVDVPPARFVEEALTFRPDVIGLSGLTTVAHASMRNTVMALHATARLDGRAIPVVVGGQIDEQVWRYSGADYWSNDAMEGVRICQRITLHSRNPQGLERRGAQ